MSALSEEGRREGGGKNQRDGGRIKGTGGGMGKGRSSLSGMRDARGEEACRCREQEVQCQEDWG